MIYDYYTKNQTFLDVHNALAKQDIKNNSFMLQLDNLDLLNLDPFNPNLTEAEKLLIAKECVGNFWYFIREVLRWPMCDGSLVPTQLDMGNAAMYWNTLNGISTWRTNIRQTCSDLSVNSILLWNLISKNVTTNVISKELVCAKDNLEKILELSKSSAIDLSPIIEPIYDDIKCTNVRLLRNIMIPSDLRSIFTPRSKNDAINLLRGDASEIMFFHMAEFIPNLESIIDNREPVMHVPGVTRINIFNSPYGPSRKLTTVFAQRYIGEMLQWEDKFYDYDSKTFALLLVNFLNDVVYIKHDYKTLGYTDEWFNVITSDMDEVTINHEILLKRV